MRKTRCDQNVVMSQNRGRVEEKIKKQEEKSRKLIT